MSSSIFIGLAVVIAFAAFVQGAIGVGFALIVGPVLALTYPELLPGGLLLLMPPLNAFAAWRSVRRWTGMARAGSRPGGWPGHSSACGC